MMITAYTIKRLIGRITDKKYLTGINKEVIQLIRDRKDDGLGYRGYMQGAHQTGISTLKKLLVRSEHKEHTQKGYIDGQEFKAPFRA